MREKNKLTPQKDLNDWIKYQLSRGNIIRNLINFIIFPALVFWLVGQFYNNLVIVLQGFLLVYFLLIPLIMTNDVIIDSQNAYLDGKWVVKEIKDSDSDEERQSIWRRITPKMLILGAIPAGLSYIAFWIYRWLTGNNTIPLDPWTLLLIAAFIALIPSCLITHIWIKRHLAADLSAFVVMMKKPKRPEPEPFHRYFTWEHALPWAIILALLNLIINLKGFAENAHIDGVILPLDLVYSVWITTLVLLCWMGLSAMNQVRADVHLGKVSEGRSLQIWLWVIFILGIPILIGGLVYVISTVLSITEISIAFSTSLIIAIAVIAGVLGRGLGIWLGITWESKKIRSEN
ncbi:MAG: hypothetical protein ACTSQI_16100 [Candidatus Helarchaeota archaeon]